MSERFRAFSFVDRIHSLEPGGTVRGDYTVPSRVPGFPLSLAAEAVGQLAAWASMAALDFRYRPVAGIAAEVHLLGLVRPGQLIQLAADLETVDNEAVAYSGVALVDGTPVVRLEHCVGPMLPVEGFDDPETLRDRFALLRGAGSTSGGFPGLPAMALTIHRSQPDGSRLQADFQVPPSAPLFEDHFPRRPVFPGSLLMNLNLELAHTLVRHAPSLATGGPWVPAGLADMKLRDFAAPGDFLGLEATLGRPRSDAPTVTVKTYSRQQLISNVCVLFTPSRA
jgi:3-hydroxymyristoyl/3-hydroxydecanoyl-(acyl carrier protein) dehydratase